VPGLCESFKEVHRNKNTKELTHFSPMYKLIDETENEFRKQVMK